MIQRRLRLQVAQAVLTLGFIAMSPPSHAGWLDSIFGNKKASEPEAPSNNRGDKRVWMIGEFTQVRLVPIEAGAGANQHPTQVQGEGLRQALAAVRIGTSKGEALFSSDELADLLQPLAEAFATAGPNDDVLLTSTSRRGGSFIEAPLGLTARLFVRDGQMNMIVHDTRRDFVDQYRGSHVQPEFVYGARGKASAAVIVAPTAVSKRADWLAFSMNAPLPAPVPMAAPATPPAPIPIAAPVAGAATPTAPAPMPPAAPVAATAPPAGTASPAATGHRDTAFFEEQEQRLGGLKRLRDRGLITEEEYQQKRREVLQGL